MEYLQKAVENDDRNFFAAVDLLKVYMANVSTYKIKIDEILSDPKHKVGRHYVDILTSKAVFSYLDGNSQQSVDLLIKAVTTNAKCIDAFQVRVKLTSI